MNHYSEVEREDAKAVASINHNIQTDIASWNNSLSILHDIRQRIPDDYQGQFNFQGTYYVKFWNEGEVESYLNKVKIEGAFEPLPNAYPQCCYLLSIIFIEQGRHDEALTAIAKGLDLEPDHPLLLCQMAMLKCKIGKVNGDREGVKKALGWYKAAFTSRPYNTPAQKSLALRGMGFMCIELQDWHKAQEYYEYSLTWQDTTSARQQLLLIQEAKNKPNATVSVRGSNLDKEKQVGSYEIFHNRVKKLPQILQDNIPDKFAYIWTKASLLDAKGAKQYRETDYFKYPLPDWSLEDIRNGSYQINHYLKGFHADHALEGLTDEGLEELMMTFHFKKTEELLDQNSRKELVKEVRFKHLIDESTLTLYSLVTAKTKKSWWKF